MSDLVWLFIAGIVAGFVVIERWRVVRARRLTAFIKRRATLEWAVTYCIQHLSDAYAYVEVERADECANWSPATRELPGLLNQVAKVLIALRDGKLEVNSERVAIGDEVLAETPDWCEAETLVNPFEPQNGADPP